jgi:lysozyme
MIPSPAGLALVKEFEQGPQGGFAATPYRCPAGHRTIGWGHRVQRGETFPTPLTAEQAEGLLVADLQVAAEIVNDTVRVRLTQSMVDALVSLVFNIGAARFETSTLRAQLNAGAYRAAADQFLRWDKATNPKTGKKEPLAGLTRRRQAERARFLKEGLPR